MEYKVNLPYPKIEVEKKDKRVASFLLNSYAGRVSEDTAIHDYIFQMMMLDNPIYKKTLKGIAIVEMHHLEILGNLIYALGCTPLFGKVEKNEIDWFTGSYANYDNDFTSVLQNDIEEEQKTIEQYQKVIRLTNDLNVKQVLQRIILDEEYHIELFSKMLREVTKR